MSAPVPHSPAVQPGAASQTRGTPAYYAQQLFTRLRIGQVNRYYFLVLAVDDLPRVPRGYAIVELQPGDPRLAEMVPQQGVQDYRFDQGCVCVGAFMGDQLAGVAWFATGKFAEDEVRADYRPGANEAWDLGLEVGLAYRRTRAVLAILGGLRQSLEVRGITKTISRIADSNAGSLALHDRLHARRCGTALFVRLGPLQLCVSTMQRGIHASLSAARRPLFEFGAL